MKVLVITGDKSFKAGNQRFDLQNGAVRRLDVLYCGLKALWPTPPGDFYDVVTTQDPFFRGLVGLFWAKRFKARFNVQLHADLRAQSFLKRIIARFVLRRADSVRVVSERLKTVVEQILRRPTSQKVTVLPVFIDIERFKAIVRKPNDQPTIVWIGRFEHEKDPLRALSVFKEVLKEVVDAKLIMLGSGSLGATLRGAARDLPVEFPGWTDPAPYLQRAQVVLSTSRAESFGSSIVEALAAGVPVVAPDVGIALEAGAIVVEREKLAEATLDVLQSKPFARLMIPMFREEAWVQEWKNTLI